MPTLSKKNLIFLLFFITLSTLFIACSSTKKNKDPIEIVSPADAFNSKEKIPNIIEESLNISTSTIMLTASRINSLQYDYGYFELGLYDIKFTIIPTGKETPIEAWLYNENPVADIDFVNTTPINLTALSNDNYLLIDTLELPAGKIISMVIYFSGTTSHIQIPEKTTYLIDPIFFNYQVADVRTPKVRLNAIEQISTTDIDTVENNFHIINIAIDQSMSAGLDPYFYPESPENTLNAQYYIQLVPTTTIEDLTYKEKLELIIAGSKSVSLNTRLTINTSSFSVNANDALLTIDDSVASDLSTLNDKMPIYIKGTLLPLSNPSLTVDKIQVLTTDEKFKTYIDQLLVENKKENSTENETFLHIRDTFNAPNKDILNIKEADLLKTDSVVTFSLPQAVDSQGETMGWLCEKVLYFTNESKQPKSCNESLVTTLQLPLNNENTGHFKLVETRRGNFKTNTDQALDNDKISEIDINTLPILNLEPDIQHHFTHSKAFYALLKTKVLDEGYRVGVLEAKGIFEDGQFQVIDTMKAILLAPQPLLDSQTDGWLEEVEEAILAKKSTPSSLSTGAIAGIAVGGGIAAIGLIASTILLNKKARQNSQMKSKKPGVVPIVGDSLGRISTATGGRPARYNTNNSSIELDGEYIATVNENRSLDVTDVAPNNISQQELINVQDAYDSDYLEIKDISPSGITYGSATNDVDDYLTPRQLTPSQTSEVDEEGYSSIREVVNTRITTDNAGYLVPSEIRSDNLGLPPPLPERQYTQPLVEKVPLPTIKEKTKWYQWKRSNKR